MTNRKKALIAICSVVAIILLFVGMSFVLHNEEAGVILAMIIVVGYFGLGAFAK